METATPIWRPNAPFRQYAWTDEDAHEDGFKSGLEWPAKWNHVPGGPWVPSYDKSGRRGDSFAHPDWVAYCEKLERHHALWMKGWLEGFAENARRSPEIKRLRSKLILEKLAA